MFWNFVSALDAGIHVIIPKFPTHLFKLVSHSRQLVLRTKLYIEVNVHNSTSNIIQTKSAESEQHQATCNPHRKVSVSWTFAPPWYLNVAEIWTCG